MAEAAPALAQARNLIALRRYDDAIDLLGNALARDPQNADLHLEMAYAHQQADRPDEALLHARRALQLEVSIRGLHVAAVAHRFRREWDESIDLIDDALDREPASPHLHVGRAMTLLGPWMNVANGPQAEAERVADTHDPRIAGARASTATARSLDPELALVPFTEAFAAIALDDLPGAARLLERAVHLDPEWSAAHRTLGQVRARQGMSRLASRHFAAAGRLDPTDTEPLGILRRLAAPFGRRAKRRGDLDLSRVVPEARRILEADLWLRGRRTATQERE